MTTWGVTKHLPNAVISTVNFSEVITVLADIGISTEEAEKILSGIFHQIIPFSQEQAVLAANLRKITKPLGLSLGDRACLALAQQIKTTVITADKAWDKIGNQFKVCLIR